MRSSEFNILPSVDGKPQNQILPGQTILAIALGLILLSVSSGVFAQTTGTAQASTASSATATPDQKFAMTLQVGNPGGVSNIVFSKDGTMFATANSSNRSIKVWSIKGKLLRTIDNGEDLTQSEMAFSPDGKYFAYTNYTYFKIYNFDSGSLTKVTVTSDVASRMVNGIVFAPDGKSVFVGSSLTITTTIPLEIAPPKFTADLAKLAKPKAQVMSSMYLQSPDKSKFLLNLDLPDHSGLYEILPGLGYDISTFTPHYSNGIERWDIQGNYIGRVAEHNNIVGKLIYKLAISGDGSMLLTASNDGMVKVWDTNGNPVVAVQGSDFYYNVAFSSDGKLFGWTSYTGVKVCNLNGIYLVNINRTMSGSSDLNLDSRFFVEYAYDLDANKNTIIKIRTRNLSDKIISETPPMTGSGFSMRLQPGGKLAAAGMADGRISLANIDLNQVVSMVNDQNDWLTFTADGYWDASKNGGKLAAMVQDLDAFSLDQFASTFNRPDIILKRLGTETDDVIQHFYNQYQKRLRKLNLKESDLSNDLHVPEVRITETKQRDKFADLSFTASDNAANLTRYNVFVNDVAIYGALGKPVQGRSVKMSESVELTTGDNKIEISVMNDKGAESFRALTRVTYAPATKHKLYYLGFGVSNYTNTALNLNFAAKDAQDLESAFKKMKGQFSEVITKTYVDSAVTAKNITDAKTFLKDATVDDTFVLFIAGHGVHDTDQFSTYYYVTYDTDIKNLAGTAANFDTIEELLQGVAPRDKLFLMDTCESGDVDPDSATTMVAMAGSRGLTSRAIPRGLTVTGTQQATQNSARSYLQDTDRFIYNDLVRRSGAIVFSACKGGEFSYESADVGNGLFTRAVLDGLSARDADKNGDGAVSTEELRQFVAAQVQKNTQGLQNPTVDRDNISIKFGFPLVASGSK